VSKILKINKDSLQAIDGTRRVVTKLRSICKLAVIALNSGHSKETFEAAIKVFLTSSDEVLPEVKIAIDKIVVVIADSSQGNYRGSENSSYLHFFVLLG